VVFATLARVDISKRNIVRNVFVAAQ